MFFLLRAVGRPFCSDRNHFWRLTWSLVCLFGGCWGCFPAANSVFLPAFFGLVRRSVFSRDVSARLLVFALSKLPFSYANVNFFGLARTLSSCRQKIRLPDDFFLLMGFPRLLGYTIGIISALCWRGLRRVEFPGPVVLRLGWFSVFSEDVYSEIIVFAAPDTFVSSHGSCHFAAFVVDRR